MEKVVYKAEIVPKIFSRSPVDIIIPFHGQCDRVAKLVESILICTQSNPYRITLVDDCSPNSDFITQMEKVPQVKILRNKKTLGFGGALYEGFKSTQQPWVVFMHSDVVIENTQWLINLGSSLVSLKSQDVRLISARSDNPGEGFEFLKADKESIEDRNIILKEGFLPLYCSMAHRDLFEHIGGFVKSYPYAYYEDEELGYRMRSFGFKQAVCCSSWVHHEAGSTIKEICSKNPNIKNIIEANYDRCINDLRNLK